MYPSLRRRPAAFAYVSNHSDNTVSQYATGASGALTARSPATVPTGAFLSSIMTVLP